MSPQLLGYTREVWAECDEASLHLLILPDQDLDERFKAYDLETNTWLMVNGWLFSDFEDC